MDLPKWARRFYFERKLREYLWSEGFEETRTPLLVESPGMEPHIRPIEIKSKPHPVFLPSSPEFAMKKLISMGLPKIFQICPAFRDEPMSPDHHPEFTMLEIYETNVDLIWFQNRIEKLFEHLAIILNQKTILSFRGEKVDFSAPWPKLRIVDLFQMHAGIDLRLCNNSKRLFEECKKNGLTSQLDSNPNESWDDLYFKLWLNLIEPKLPKNKPVMISHYPKSQSSLCNLIQDEAGFWWANRFEVYVGNFELGNSFDELRDPHLQRTNFLHDQKIRRETYGNDYPESPIDESFLQAIAKMPPTCGIALGLDRMAMLFLEADHIDDVIPLKSYWN